MIGRLRRTRAFLAHRLGHVKTRLRRLEAGQNNSARARAGHILARARVLKRLAPIYVLGGGHTHTPAVITAQSGADCSSACCFCLQGALDIETTDTSGLARAPQLKDGPGLYVQILILTGLGGPDDHVIFGVRKRLDRPFKWFEQGGRDNPRGGCFSRIFPSQERLREFKVLRSIPGL